MALEDHGYDCGCDSQALTTSWKRMQRFASQGGHTWVQLDPIPDSLFIDVLGCLACGCHGRPSRCSLTQSDVLFLIENRRPFSCSVAIRLDTDHEHGINLENTDCHILWAPPKTGPRYRSAGYGITRDRLVGLSKRKGTTISLRCHILRDTTETQEVIRNLDDDCHIQNHENTSFLFLTGEVQT